MMQLPILSIAVVLVWFAMGGQAQWCRVTLIWQHRDYMFADLILEPSAGVTCDDLTSPQVLYDAMDTHEPSKANFRPTNLNFFLNQKSRSAVSYAITSDFDKISGILSSLKWVPWRYDTLTNGAVFFEAADYLLADMYKPLSELEPIVTGQNLYGVLRTTSSLPPGYVLHVTVGTMFWITAIFEFAGPDPFNSGTDVLTHAWESKPNTLFVKFPSDNMFFERQIWTGNWGYIVRNMKDFAHVDFLKTDALTAEVPTYAMNFLTLADAINKNEKSIRQLRRKLRRGSTGKPSKLLTQLSSELLESSAESLAASSSELSSELSESSSESSAESASDESESQAISRPKTLADKLKPKSVAASKFILSFNFPRKASRQQGPHVKGAL